MALSSGPCSKCGWDHGPYSIRDEGCFEMDCPRLAERGDKNVRDAVEAEREACARLAEGFSHVPYRTRYDELAAAIRERTKGD